MSTARSLPLAVVAGVLVAPTLPAQRVPTTPGVQVTQGLDFGPVIQGVPARVDRQDGARAGRVEIVAAARARVFVQLVLPGLLERPGTARSTLALEFGAADAGYSAQQQVSQQTPFDPRAGTIATLNEAGRGTVFLGGTLVPAPRQPPGPYQAIVTITVTYAD
ncbi:MAG: hypothetical protein NW201_09685 [Gemmatimonadales bacterium]|nr:hypothetical protein [Gemmatimonadales bacterium]